MKISSTMTWPLLVLPVMTRVNSEEGTESETRSTRTMKSMWTRGRWVVFRRAKGDIAKMVKR